MGGIRKEFNPNCPRCCGTGLYKPYAQTGVASNYACDCAEVLTVPAHDSGATVSDGTTAAIHRQAETITALHSQLDEMTKEFDFARSALRQAAAERDEARAEVERLNKEADSLAQQREHWQLRFGEVCDERNEATDRIAALEAVIRAQAEHARALARTNQRAFELAEAAHAAGMEVVETVGRD